MKKVKVIVLRTAGTNCDVETAHAFFLAGSEPHLVHINSLKDKRNPFDRYKILAIPGGFTYGDDVASGKVLANELRSSLGSQINRFISRGNLVIGICNGFQVLVKTGILPGIGGARKFNIESTLALNDSGKFIAKWVYLKKNREPGKEICVWTRSLPDLSNMPVAHAEGKFMPKDQKVLNTLKANGQIVLRYSDRDGRITGGADNPNGSVDNIAGICDPTGRILGMMPHPERNISRFQHPGWRRKDHRLRDMGIGLQIFRSGVEFARKSCTAYKQ